ncbi:MAG: isoleucine--tRNA ligase, partial [Sulfobacillus sp.]|nr:isoleucine--tRNA ligase [Sulfobacillus sp.]
RLFGYREVILKAIEEKRAAKILGNSLAARVVLHLPAGENLSRDDQGLLTELVMAAEIVPVTGDILQAVAEPTDWARCERCWRHTPDVSEDDHLCERCRGVLAQSVE